VNAAVFKAAQSKRTPGVEAGGEHRRTALARDYSIRQMAIEFGRPQPYVRGVGDGIGVRYEYAGGALWVSRKDYLRIKAVVDKAIKYRAKPGGKKVAA